MGNSATEQRFRLIPLNHQAMGKDPSIHESEILSQGDGSYVWVCRGFRTTITITHTRLVIHDASDGTEDRIMEGYLKNLHGVSKQPLVLRIEEPSGEVTMAWELLAPLDKLPMSRHELIRLFYQHS